MLRAPVTGMVLADAAATERLGADIAAQLLPGDLVLLEGPLGAGKTTAVRGMVGALGGDPGEVGSPTFILIDTYDVDLHEIRRVHHADLYRLRGRPAALTEELGLHERLEDPHGVTAVEWPQGWSWTDLGADRILLVRLCLAVQGREADIGWISA